LLPRDDDRVRELFTNRALVESMNSPFADIFEAAANSGGLTDKACDD
jgi:hypothetical protein